MVLNIPIICSKTSFFQTLAWFLWILPFYPEISCVRAHEVRSNHLSQTKTKKKHVQFEIQILNLGFTG